MHMLFRTLTCTLVAVAVAGCGLVYQPPLYQGNLLTKTTVDKLKPGMTKRQVIVLLGSPSVASPFKHDRWDYVHASSLHGDKLEVNTLSLYFNNDTLVRTEGNLFAANNKKMLEQAQIYNEAGAENAGGTKGDNPVDTGE